MKRVAMLCLTLFLLPLAAFPAWGAAGQSATPEEFKELCASLEGRWIGVWTVTVDPTGGREGGFLGKKGEEVIIHADRRMTADGSAVLATYYAGDGTVTELTYYDPTKERIKRIEAHSGGTVWHGTFFKKDGQWRLEGNGGHPDGTQSQASIALTISDGGDTHTYTGAITPHGTKATRVEVTYRRIAR